MADNEHGNFEMYLDRFCELHNISREEALSIKMVQLVKEYYDEDVFTKNDTYANGQN